MRCDCVFSVRGKEGSKKLVIRHIEVVLPGICRYGFEPKDNSWGAKSPCPTEIIMGSMLRISKDDYLRRFGMEMWLGFLFAPIDLESFM